MNKSPSRYSKANAGWFSKGRSGNLKGRPKKSASKGSTFEVLVEKTVTVATKSGSREISVEEALQHRTYQDALAGKSMAIREVVKWMIKREAWLAKHEPKVPRLVDFLFPRDPDNADPALVLLKIAMANPRRSPIDETPRLLLDTWATQAALRRRRGGERLTDEECNNIRRCTRDSDRLRWPRGAGR